jgi:tripartite-type tricarboxylate transporter receptor subunit TctC
MARPTYRPAARPRSENKRKYLFLKNIFCAALMGSALPAVAQTQPQAQSLYPARAVRIVVPYPPGGGNDIIARAYADELTKRLAQPFIIDNRPGASTIIGAEVVAKAPPDGHMALVSSHTTFAIVPNLRLKPPYDVLRDFEAVSLLATQPLVLAVHPSLPARDVRQLVALARAQPGALTYSSAGVGSGGHFSGELFNTLAGVDLRHIPYKGSAPALTDLVGGQVSISYSTLAAVQAFVRNGRLRLLAVTSAQRSPLAPGVPSVAESGVPGYDMRGWNAMVLPVLPRGAAKTVVERLNNEINAIVRAPDLRERLAAQGYEPEAGTPQQLSEMFKTELTRYAGLVKSVGMKPE